MSSPKGNPNGSAGPLISSNSAGSNSSTSSQPTASKESDQRFSMNNLTNNNSSAKKAKREKSDLDPQPTDLKGKHLSKNFISDFRYFLAPSDTVVLVTLGIVTVGNITGDFRCTADFSHSNSGESRILS